MANLALMDDTAPELVILDEQLHQNTGITTPTSTKQLILMTIMAMARKIIVSGVFGTLGAGWRKMAAITNFGMALLQVFLPQRPFVFPMPRMILAPEDQDKLTVIPPGSDPATAGGGGGGTAGGGGVTPSTPTPPASVPRS